MKSLALALLLACTSVLASTRDTETFSFDGTQIEKLVSLRAEKTHTEYRVVTQTRTCWRREIVGYNTVCRRPPPPQPQTCQRIPIYRDVPYTCYEQVRVPYEVFDYNVVANVAVEFGDVPAGISASENVTVELRGDSLSMSSTGSKRLILELADLAQNRRLQGNTMMIDVRAKVKLHDAAPVKAALALSGVSVRRNVLSYNLGPIEGVGIGQHLKIVRNPIIGSSTIVHEGELGAGVLSAEPRENGTSLRVDFRQLLGNPLGKGRYDVTIKAYFKSAHGVLNDEDLGGLSPSRTVRYTIN